MAKIDVFNMCYGVGAVNPFDCLMRQKSKESNSRRDLLYDMMKAARTAWEKWMEANPEEWKKIVLEERMRKEKKFEDTDVFSYAAGMMGTVDMEANCRRMRRFCMSWACPLSRQGRSTTPVRSYPARDCWLRSLTKLSLGAGTALRITSRRSEILSVRLTENLTR